jgi:hypothetical protein
MLLVRAQRFKKAIDAVAGESKDGIDPPFHQPFDD